MSHGANGSISDAQRRGGLRDLAPSDPKLLWVVRPCFGARAKCDGGGGVWRGFAVHRTFFSIAAIVETSLYLNIWPLLDAALVLLVFPCVWIAPPLRRFAPHRCHAACRIVVMAEESLAAPEHGGGGVGVSDGGSSFWGAFKNTFPPPVCPVKGHFSFRVEEG